MYRHIFQNTDASQSATCRLESRLQSTRHCLSHLSISMTACPIYQWLPVPFVYLNDCLSHLSMTACPIYLSQWLPVPFVYLNVDLNPDSSHSCLVDLTHSFLVDSSWSQEPPPPPCSLIFKVSTIRQVISPSNLAKSRYPPRVLLTWAPGPFISLRTQDNKCLLDLSQVFPKYLTQFSRVLLILSVSWLKTTRVNWVQSSWLDSRHSCRVDLSAWLRVVSQEIWALQHTTHCNTLQHTSCLESRDLSAATHCNTLQHTATHFVSWVKRLERCNTQHTATHCNTLQHTATHCNTLRVLSQETWALQHATHCNTLQHTATHFMSWVKRLEHLHWSVCRESRELSVLHQESVLNQESWVSCIKRVS